MRANASASPAVRRNAVNPNAGNAALPKRTRTRGPFTFIVCLFLCAAVAAMARPAGTRLLLLVGSNTLGERAVPELAKAWMESEKQAKNVSIVVQGETIYVTGKLPNGSPAYVEIHATGSGDCFKSFMGLYTGADAKCDIGMSSRGIFEPEATALEAKYGASFTQRGREPGQGTEHPIGLDGLAIVVHKSNPLSRISFTELKAIYSRKVTDWKQLKEWADSGGAAEGGAIVPFRRKEPSGTLDYFKERIRPDPGPMQNLNAIAAFTSSGDLTDKVAATIGGIGFVGQSYALHPGVKRLQVYDDTPQGAMNPDQAVFPDAAAVSRQIYPLSRVVFLYTAPVSLNPDVAPFVRFVLSERGQAILADRGGLVKVEGTENEIRGPARGEVAPVADSPPGDGRKKNVILRLAGSNTVGAQCAVTLAFNYFMTRRQKSNPGAKIEDVTTPIETPEGEKALIHSVECNLDKGSVPQSIEIRPTGSSDAFIALGKGLCDVGMSSRPITDSERRDLMSVCGNLSQPAAQFALGLDALAIIVSPNNKVDQLTLEQVRRIFLGEIKNWSEVGGDSLPIQVHTRPERSGTYKYFCDSVLVGRSVPDSAKRHAENSALSAAVAEEPGGIGFVPMSATGHAKVLRVGLEGSPTATQPTEDTVRAGRYPGPLCRYVYLYVPAAKPESPTFEARHNWETARDFAESSHSWRGQAIVASSGFVTEITAIDEGGQARRGEGEPVMPYLQRLSDLERKANGGGLRPKLVNGEICPRLLFEFDDWVLTPESKNIVDKKLGPLLKMYPSLVKGGLVAEGWADSVGSDEVCREISLQRAKNVASYIRDSLGVEVAAVGKGKSFDPPNIDEASKQQNRRVAIKVAFAPPENLTKTADATVTPKPQTKRKKQ
jgi:ABC-type phosphate transport system substrate-binding protein